MRSGLRINGLLRNLTSTDSPDGVRSASAFLRVSTAAWTAVDAMKPWGHWVSVTISTVKTGPADSAGSVEPIAVTSATATKKNSASRAARDEDAMAGKEEEKSVSS